MFGLFSKTYDPSWLIEAAKHVEDEYPWLSKALGNCTRSVSSSRYYVHFVSSWRANKRGSPWQFQENIILEDTIHGDVILDILSEHRVGGVEFLSRLLERP